MKGFNILICEGNTPEEGKIFQDVGIPTHTESLKESLAYYNKNLRIDVLNPCLELNLNEVIPKLKKYDGLIWGGSSLNIYNDTIRTKIISLILLHLILMKWSLLQQKQFIWHQIKLIKYKVLILKVVLVKFGVCSITLKLLIKK